MKTVTSTSPGATKRLSLPIVTGPRDRMSHAMRIATRPTAVTRKLPEPKSVPAAPLATCVTARPTMIASSDDQPISVTRMTVNTSTPTPMSPNTGRRIVYCSTPKRALAAVAAGTMMPRPIALPMTIAAIPSWNPTSSAVEPPTRNAHVAIARLRLTQL